MGRRDTSGSAETQLHAKNIAVVGLGLMGASLATALKRWCPDCRVLGWARREKSIRDALAHDMIDGGSTVVADVLPAADLTVICLPLEPTILFVREHAGLWREGTLVTDVGSVKGTIVRGCRPPLTALGVRFVGSHPMAGSEKTGLESATGDLYDNATVFVTPVPEDPARDVDEVSALWRSVGACPVRMTGERHDALVARTSHMLHLLAAAATDVVLEDEEAPLATAGAFRDMTRIAASSPDMWTQICRHNQEKTLAACDALMRAFARTRDQLAEADWPALQATLQRARLRRNTWLSARNQRKEESE